MANAASTPARKAASSRKAAARPAPGAAAPAPAHGPIPHRETGAANPYLPFVATVREVIKETHNIMTFRVTLDDKELMESFRFEPGQVGQLSLFGAGESTFVINSPPTRREYLQFSVMRAGEVTAALHGLRAGDKVGVRAPLGNHFPYHDMKGKDIVFIGGGIGMAPLRTLLLFMLDNRKEYGKITLLYGARSPQDMAYAYELPDWLSRPDMETVLTIDREAEGWEHRVGLIPNVLLEMAPSPENAVAVTCGPPIMIKFTMEALDKLKFTPDQIITTLERRMKCGIGICGRCNIGGKYVCVDGPVFTAAALKGLPNEL
jgi:NAD(P)H-flavin reductase